MNAWLEHPEAWPALALACGLLALGLVSGARRAGARRQRLLGGDRARDTRSALRDALLIVALASVAIGWLGPRIGRVQIEPAAGGVDVVLLFDLSQSMDAQDTAPSRLRRAIDHAGALLECLAAGDRIALAGFAGRGVLFTPLTPDRDALASMLPHLDSRLLRPGGSDLAAGLAAALPAFDVASTRPRIVVVWSDGEISDPQGSVGDAAAQGAHVRVVAVGIGSEAGSPVPDHGAALLDASGLPVVSRRFLGPLERLAAATDGVVLPADRFGQVDVEALTAQVDRDTLSPDAVSPAPESAVDARPAARSLPVAIAWPFAGFAFVALLAEAGLAARAPRRPQSLSRSLARAARRRWVGLSGLVLALAIGWRADARDGAGSRSAAEWLARGVARALAGDAIGAARDLEAASVLANDPAVVARAEYDLGVLALMGGDLESARDHFLTSLVHAPDDHEARFNAEWTLRAIAARADIDDPGAAARATAIPDDETKPDRAPEEAPPGDARADASASPEAGETDSGATDAGAATSGDASSGAMPLAGMSAEERARWLDQVVDDPGRSLQLGAAAERPGTRTERSSMTW